MKSEQTWSPTKFVRRKGILRASRDPAEIGVGSRLIGDLVARFYDENIPKFASGNLVDLGCGKAPLFDTYRKHVSAVTCVDWKAPDNGQDHLDCVCDLSSPLPFDDGQFQTIILSDVLEHIPEPHKLWAELARLLSPGGHLIMNTPFMHCLHEQPHDYYRFSSHALTRFAASNGFEIIIMDAIGGTPEVMADIAAKHLQFVPIVGKLFSRAIQGLTYWFVNTKPGSSFSKKTSNAFPLGYALVARRLES
jgi:2-polyprenyl-3-methyl-5-hydroxy-6-metoxy-1,4-benzoquinol methylase